MNTRTVPHPSFFIDEHIIDTLRKYAGEAERAGSLNPQQLSIIYKEHWFNLFVPKEYGGLELSLPEALSIQEALAWADGSTGWTVTLCSGANWFIGTPQECRHGCHLLIAELLAKLWTRYDIDRTPVQ